MGSGTNAIADIGFTISEDGRTATSVRAVDPWGGAGPAAWFDLEVDPDRAPGTVLGDGTFRIVQGENPRAEGSVVVTVDGTDLRITEHPADTTVFVHEPTVLRVAAQGTGAMTVDWQWRSGPDGDWQAWDDDPEATQPRWSVEVQLEDVSQDGRQYRAVVRDAWGATVESDPATLSVWRIRPLHLTLTAHVTLISAESRPAGDPGPGTDPAVAIPSRRDAPRAGRPRPVR